MKYIDEDCISSLKTHSTKQVVAVDILNLFIIPHRTIVAGYCGFMLIVRVSLHPSICLSYVRPSVLSFPDNDLSKCQWIFTKLGMCIDIVEIWFGIANKPIFFNC